MQYLLSTILDTINEGIIAIDSNGCITHFNRSAGLIAGIDPDGAMGKPIVDVLPRSTLPTVLETGIPETNATIEISDQKQIIANRVAVFNHTGAIVGAVSIFRDMTRVSHLTDQNIVLEDMQGLLEAIIHASLDAISVVDEKGRGLIINPAYTRLTGLTQEDILGKPAEIDITTGESAHRRVLKTCKPLCGARLKIKPHNREVLANVAPIIVDGKLRGSVAIVHDLSRLKAMSDELTSAKRIIRTLSAKYSFSDIIGQSKQILDATNLARNAAKVPVTVLLRGESGTGKELFAHAIHNASSRKDKQFVRVNCAAVVESLFESELFGYKGGAFTGARHDGKKGFFEEAHQGTIFLDEVSELSINIQAKLLRVLQEKEFVRVGGSKTTHVDVRIIAATHVNLEEAVQAGRFRQDLYYRLNVMPIFIPPLRNHKTDLKLLTDHIIEKLNQEFGRNVLSIHPRAMEIIDDYPWHGNVRELENILAQGITKMRFSESVIRADHLPDLRILPSLGWDASPKGPDGSPVHAGLAHDPDLKTIVAEVEKAYIRKILADCRWNKTASALKLGISIRSLYNKMHRYDIDRS